MVLQFNSIKIGSIIIWLKFVCIILKSCLFPTITSFIFFSFGLIPVGGLTVGTLQPSQSIETTLPLQVTGPVQRMEPLNNLQVA